jgi:hypothetical protein
MKKTLTRMLIMAVITGTLTGSIGQSLAGDNSVSLFSDDGFLAPVIEFFNTFK